MSIRITSQRASAIDEYGRLHRQLVAHQPEQKRLRLLAEEIESWAEREPAEATIVLDGQAYRVSLSPRSREAVIDVAAAFKLLGAAKFLRIASLRVEPLRQVVDEDRFERIVTYDRTGRRRLTPVPRLVEVALAA